MNVSAACIFTLAVICLAGRSQAVDIPIAWSLPTVNGGFEDVDAVLGDTITFTWPATENHTVYINPTGTCDDTDSILVGDGSPVIYPFTASDATRSPLFFADNLDQFCENGLGFFVTVTDDEAPTTSPEESPDVEETEVPTELSTTAPTAAPPVATPTLPPVESTMAPTTAVPATSSPTAPPPTDIPVVPTDTPTDPPEEPTNPPVEPTDAPVAPSEAPILIVPTSPPVAPTDEPSAQPVDTSLPSVEVVETNQPTMAPTPAGSITESLSGLRMGLAGVTAFPPSTQSNWEQLTKEFSESFTINDLSGIVSNFVTTYQVTDVIATERRYRSLIRAGARDLQQEAIILEFTQTFQYDTSDPSITPEALATRPFEENDGKQAYVTLLRSSEDQVLQGVIGVSNVIVATTQPPTAAPADDPFLSTPAIIGIACGGGALLILIVLYLLYCRGSGSGGGAGKDVNHDDEPPLHVNVRDDEVSTLAGPTGPPTYGDQSVATVDYDYSKAYGGAGDTSVSSAGGTFGSNTQNQSALDPANAAATGAALGAMPSDDNFDPGFRDANNVKEEIIHIFAPPGKLGVVIDTPDDGAPVVHAVKDSSVIADKIAVGDKLIAVDDEDVRSMTAIKVSKLISRKSANPSRKLTVVRTTLLD